MREDSDIRETGRPRRRTGVSLKIPILIIVLVLTVAAAVALMLPTFNVVEVYCEGNSDVKTEDIITAAKLETGKNIFLENLGRARRNVEAINSVKSAEIRRVFPNKICISVSERVPFAYVPSNGGLALISEDEVVLKVLDGGEAAVISEAKTPKFDNGQTDGGNTDEKNSDRANGGDANENTDKSGDTADKGDASDSNNNSQNSDKQGSDNSNSDDGKTSANSDKSGEVQDNADISSVPLVSGVEIKNAKEGKKAESGDCEKLNKLYELCRALRGAELLNRTTYINIENSDSITAVIENRLEVQLGKADNINYRCRFLAEVINTKLSATESVILDYTGDDIYAINRDDGGERVKKTKSGKNTADGEISDGKKTKSADSDNGGSNDSDRTGNSDDSDGASTDSNKSGGSSVKKSSGSSETNSADEQDEYL